MAKRGETREVILKAATKVFFENGYEDTSVKMIRSEAGIVVGSFYHFFESKEALFEGVVERFIDEYTEGISKLINDEELGFYDMIGRYVDETIKANKIYYEMLNGDKLHWSLQYALHDRILDTIIKLFTDMLSNRIETGELINIDNMDINILATILVKGMDTLVSEKSDTTLSLKLIEKYISVNTGFKRTQIKKVADIDAKDVKAIDKHNIKINESFMKNEKKNKKKVSKNAGVKDEAEDNNKAIIKENIEENTKENTKNNSKEKEDNRKPSKKKDKPKKSEEVTYQQMSIFEFE